MKYIVRTLFEGELTWEGEAENVEEAGTLADNAIAAMQTSDEYERRSSFIDQIVEPLIEDQIEK